jgi:hypothetical protein
MDEVPEQLDGAVVRWSAPAMPGCVGHDYATGEPVSIAYFAIARYEGEWESVAGREVRGSSFREGEPVCLATAKLTGPERITTPALKNRPSSPQYHRLGPAQDATELTLPQGLSLVRKLLVANRSEIATRVFRAATELGLGTVAVYTYEDRFSLHRFKAMSRT